MMPPDGTHDRDEHGVDRLVRAAALKADAIDWRLSSEDLQHRRRPALSMARYRSLAAGLVVAALIVAVFVAPLPQMNLFHTYSRTSVPPPRQVRELVCPKTRLDGSIYWVPARAHGVDGSARLVPEATPSKAVICAYGGSKLTVLAGSKTLTDGLGALASELTWLPRPEETGCAGVGLRSIAGRDPVPAAYLIGLSYDKGWLWVATGYSGGCDGAGNGTFRTSDGIGSQVKRAYETGRWAAPNYSSCAALGDGRLGQDRAMVPGQPGALDICYFKAGAQFRQTEVSVPPAVSSRLRELLDAEATFPSTGLCHQRGSQVDYVLVFRYTTGPPVTVSVDRGCVPAVNNGSLQANSAAAAIGVIQRFLHG